MDVGVEGNSSAGASKFFNFGHDHLENVSVDLAVMTLVAWYPNFPPNFLLSSDIENLCSFKIEP